MNLAEIINVIGGELACGSTTDNKEITYAFASDLMSDVLTLDSPQAILVTGLNTLQTIRTVEMAEISHIILARGKKPTTEMIEVAKKEGVNIITSDKSLFYVCGLLYKAGVQPIF